MKNALVIFAFFASATAMACPDLSGAYTCKPDADEQDQTPYTSTITQVTNNGVTSYTVVDSNDPSPQVIVADGVTRESREKDSDNSAIVNVDKTTITCAAENVLVKLDWSQEPTQGYTAIAIVTVNLSDKKDLQMSSDTTVYQNNSPIQHKTEQSVCTRNP